MHIHNIISFLYAHAHILYYVCFTLITDCRPLNDPQNGRVFVFPDCNSAVYTCNPGYTISGTALVECISGRWSSPPVTCTTLP